VFTWVGAGGTAGLYKQIATPMPINGQSGSVLGGVRLDLSQAPKEWIM
jgi:hypothetical protein